VHELAAALDALEQDAALAEQVPEPADISFEPMTTSGLSSVDLAAVTRLWATSRDGAP
jgi:mycobactin peptide synthetase MbtE